MRHLLSAVAFAFIAGLIRYSLTDVESRAQIAVFWVAALIIENFRGPSASMRGLVMNGAAATLAIILVKWATEGFPPLSRALGL